MRNLQFIVLTLTLLLLNCKNSTPIKMTQQHTNSLINETSPYLLQHAHNPVNWYAWNSETLQRAKSENKLLLISVGYAACHWCHVMEEESFENDEPITNPAEYISASNSNIVLKITDKVSNCFTIGAMEINAYPTSLDIYESHYICENDLGIGTQYSIDSGDQLSDLHDNLFRYPQPPGRNGGMHNDLSVFSFLRSHNLRGCV